MAWPVACSLCKWCLLACLRSATSTGKVSLLRRQAPIEPYETGWLEGDVQEGDGFAVASDLGAGINQQIGDLSVYLSQAVAELQTAIGSLQDSNNANLDVSRHHEPNRRRTESKRVSERLKRGFEPLPLAVWMAQIVAWLRGSNCVCVLEGMSPLPNYFDVYSKKMQAYGQEVFQCALRTEEGSCNDLHICQYNPTPLMEKYPACERRTSDALEISVNGCGAASEFLLHLVRPQCLGEPPCSKADGCIEAHARAPYTCEVERTCALPRLMSEQIAREKLVTLGNSTPGFLDCMNTYRSTKGAYGHRQRTKCFTESLPDGCSFKKLMQCSLHNTSEACGGGMCEWATVSHCDSNGMPTSSAKCVPSIRASALMYDGHAKKFHKHWAQCLNENACSQGTFFIYFEIAADMFMAFNLIFFALVYKKRVVDKIEPLPDIPLPVDDFPIGLFDCLRHPSICCHAFWCADVRLAHTMAAAGIKEPAQGMSTYWAVFALTFLASAVIAPCYTPCLTAYYRLELRRKFGFKGDSLRDVVISICCFYCVVGQQAILIDELTGAHVSCCCRLQRKDFSSYVGAAYKALRDGSSKRKLPETDEAKPISPSVTIPRRKTPPHLTNDSGSDSDNVRFLRKAQLSPKEGDQHRSQRSPVTSAELADFPVEAEEERGELQDLPSQVVMQEQDELQELPPQDLAQERDGAIEQEIENAPNSR